MQRPLATHGSDPLLRRSVCAAGQPARPQVSRCTGLSGSDHEFPALTGRSGTQRARWPLRPELAALLGVCPLSQQTHEAAALGLKTHFDQKSALIESLIEIVAAGDLVLVKGSRGMKMEEVVAFLTERFKPPQDTPHQAA